MSDETTPGSEELRARIDAELQRTAPRPDVHAVLRRAREIDPDIDMLVGGAAAAADEPELETDIGLAPYVDALRDRIDVALAERALRPAPVLRPAATWRWFAAGSLTVAAMVALALVAVPGLRVSLGGDDGPASLAADDVDLDPAGGEARPGGGPSVAGAAQVRPQPRPIEPASPRTLAPPPAEQSMDAEAVAQEAETPAVRADADPAAIDPKKPTLRERIAALEVEASAAWQAGDLDDAQAGYRTIVRIGGRRRAVELAYGELFALARQRRQDPAPLWRAYTRRFPKGIYAEDAQAGLCRVSADSEREACWASYRTRFPGRGHDPGPDR